MLDVGRYLLYRSSPNGVDFTITRRLKHGIEFFENKKKTLLLNFNWGLNEFQDKRLNGTNPQINIWSFTKQGCQIFAKSCLALPARSESSSSCRIWDSRCWCKEPPRGETPGNAGIGSTAWKTFLPGVNVTKLFFLCH